MGLLGPPVCRVSSSLTWCGPTAPPTPPSLAVLSLQVRAPSRKSSVVGTRGPERKGGREAHRRPGAGSGARQQAVIRARGAVSPCSPTPTRPYFPKLPRGETRPGYVRRAENQCVHFKYISVYLPDCIHRICRWRL